MSSEPIVFIGPGSEWFWSMAQFVVVVVTLLGIYYQYRQQRSANAVEHWNRILAEWSSEPRLRIRLKAARAIKAGLPPPLIAMQEIGNFWESVGSFVRRGHIDAHIVLASTGNAAFY